MSLIFKPTTQIAFEDVSPERFKSYYGIKIIRGYEAGQVYSYLCWEGTTVRVCPDDNGYCNFAVPDNVAFPFPILDAVVREYDCGLERVIDDRGRLVPSSSDRQSIIEVLGEDHLGPGDRILACLDGSAADPEPGSVLYRQVQIAQELLQQNPQLLDDPETLLLLVGDLYAQRHPPFRVILHGESQEAAQFYADAILARAQGGKQIEFTNGLSSERENEWLNSMREEGLRIDPETAEVTWVWGHTMDPYGIHPHLPAEMRQVQRNYFARSPGSDTWVLFEDLPEQTREMLSSKPPKATRLFS